MKIFIVCASMNGGGAERVGVMLANGFSRHHHDITIITDVYQKRTYDIDKDVRVLPLNPHSKNKILRWGGAIKNIRKYVKEEKPDVIIGIMQLCSLVSRIACIGTKTTVIMTEHSAFEYVSDLPRPWHLKPSRKLLDPIYEWVTVLTEADKEFIGNKLKHVVVMPNPLSFSPVKEMPQKEKILFSAGRLTDWRYKGWDILIKAWAKIADKYPDWKLMVAGDGAESSKQYLRQLMQEYKVNNEIQFLGYRTDMLQLFQKTSIFVLSSRSEGLPMVLLEAMSQGCAPIATDYKGRTREIITSDDEGITCEPKDIDALAAGMEKLISDESFRKYVQKNAIERSKHYTLDNVIYIWEKFLKQIKESH